MTRFGEPLICLASSSSSSSPPPGLLPSLLGCEGTPLLVAPPSASSAWRVGADGPLRGDRTRGPRNLAAAAAGGARRSIPAQGNAQFATAGTRVLVRIVLARVVPRC